VAQDQHERDLIRRADEYLTEHYGVVVDDVVLQTWGNGKPRLVHRLLTTAVAESGGTADPTELLPVAASIAFPDTSGAPWLSSAESDGDFAPRSSLVEQAARLLAGELLRRLGDGGQRWRHTQAVAARAAEATHLFDEVDSDLLVAAAWLHDIGYAPKLHRHGFHPVDGAEHVEEQLSASGLAGLIAHHSGARFVAEVRGVLPLMAPFAEPAFWTGPLADALTWADQTIGPDGQRMSVEQRLHEMLLRHGPDSPNARSNARRAPAIIAAVRATEARLEVSRSCPD
jgi:hypothetical protein